ncbi:MAG: DUF6359 domain-containing protein [Candidatus Amulumruptor caecigallinarius]|nr:DUF6359 domain-containing protein [Candidatus Amulumruptor caecigallinarius]
MKKIKLIYALSLALTMGLASCSEDLTQPPVPEPEGGVVGTGAWDNPMTAWQASIGSVNYTIPTPWVKGYIVGYIVAGDGGVVLSESTAAFTAENAGNTNLLIATDKDETDWTMCATVQLPAGAVRDALNLQTNPDMLGKEVCVRGTVGEKYCGAYGVRDLIDYNIGAVGKPDSDAVSAPPCNGFYQNFSNYNDLASLINQGWKMQILQGNFPGWQFCNVNATNALGIDAVKSFAEGGPYSAVMMSPLIDMADLPEKSLEFKSCAITAAGGTDLTAFIRVYNGNADFTNGSEDSDPAAYTDIPLQAAIAEAPAFGFSEWMSSGVIDLSAYSGIVRIGWLYTAANGGLQNSVTYYIDDVNIGGYPEPADWTMAELMDTMLQPNSETCDWTFLITEKPDNMSRVWEWKQYNGAYYLNASAFMSNTNYAATAYAYSPALSLAGYTHVMVEFEHAAKFQTTIQLLGRLVVREVGSDTWTEFTIPAWPAAGSWNFGASGQIDISSFAGKNIEIGLKYESTDKGADTWEVRNLKIYGVK